MSLPTMHVLTYPFRICGRPPNTGKNVHRSTEFNITASSLDSLHGYIVHSLKLRPDRCATHDDCLQNHELGRDCWERSSAGFPACEIVRMKVDGRIVNRLRDGGLFRWYMGSILSLYVSNRCPIACEAFVDITVERVQSGFVDRGVPFYVTGTREEEDR